MCFNFMPVSFSRVAIEMPMFKNLETMGFTFEGAGAATGSGFISLKS